MAEQADAFSAAIAEEKLRQNLRESGLGWIVEQVDEGLAQLASDQDQPPSPEARLITLVDAVVFAFELAEDTATETLELLAMRDVPADRRPAFAGIEFVDPLGREETRTLSLDRQRNQAARKTLCDAADELRKAFEKGPQR